MNRAEAEFVLGLGPGWTDVELRDRWRAAARMHHPDLRPDDGGSHASMTRINEAYAHLKELRDRESAPEPVAASSARPERVTRRPAMTTIERPAFVIDALPVVAFEALLLSARILGDVIDDDPPYTLEVLIEDPVMTWCRLELVPDAGSSTVTIVSDGRVDLDVLCRLWVDAVNEVGVDQ